VPENSINKLDWIQKRTDFSFHSQTLSVNSSRVRSVLLMPLAANIFSTTNWIINENWKQKLAYYCTKCETQHWIQSKCVIRSTNLSCYPSMVSTRYPECRPPFHTEIPYHYILSYLKKRRNFSQKNTKAQNGGKKQKLVFPCLGCICGLIVSELRHTMLSTPWEATI
jgi:hypothetical protein